MKKGQTLEACQLVLHSEVAELVLYFSLDKVSWEGEEDSGGEATLDASDFLLEPKSTLLPEEC